MSAPYSLQQKIHALDQLAQSGNVAEVSGTTGISEDTLRKWRHNRREIRAAQLLEKVERLHAQLAENAVHLSAALAGSIDGAPLNQLSTALGTVIDRYLKVDEHLSQELDEQKEQVTRVEFRHPDGTLHDTPPWADLNHEQSDTVPGGRMWPPIWKNRDRQNDHLRPRGSRRHDLVAGSDLRDGERGVARSESEPAERAWAGD